MPSRLPETLQLDVRDADSIAAAQARVTEGRTCWVSLPQKQAQEPSSLCVQTKMSEAHGARGDGRKEGRVYGRGRVSLLVM